MNRKELKLEIDTILKDEVLQNGHNKEVFINRIINTYIILSFCVYIIIFVVIIEINPQIDVKLIFLFPLLSFLILTIVSELYRIKQEYANNEYQQEKIYHLPDELKKQIKFFTIDSKLDALLPEIMIDDEFSLMNISKWESKNIIRVLDLDYQSKKCKVIDVDSQKIMILSNEALIEDYNLIND